MAEREYLQRFVPNSETRYGTARVSWHGLNRLIREDSGYLTDAMNITARRIPYIVPSPTPSSVKSGYAHPISLHGFDDFLLAIYRDSDAIKADYITASGTVYTGVIKESGATVDDEYPRCVVQFNVYTTPNDPLGGTYDKKLLIFPDRLSMDFDITANFTPASINSEQYPIPAIKYAAVHLSRLFGVDDGRIYASGFNDYSMWNLDTADESLASNAWCSTAQSNTRADSAFTAITAYDNHIVCFKRDFMQQVYNTKNPFRVVDITQIGAVNNDCIAEVGGVLFFAAQNGVYAYSGGYPQLISMPLDIASFDGCCAAGYDNTYYIYCPNDEMVYTYDVTSGEWGVRSIGALLSLCSNDTGIFAIGEDGGVIKLNSEQYGAWELTTDLMLNQSTQIRRVKKIALYCDISQDAYIRADIYDDKGRLHAVLDSDGHTGRTVLRSAVRMSSAYGHKIKLYGGGHVIIKELELYASDGGESYLNQ